MFGVPAVRNPGGACGAQVVGQTGRVGSRGGLLRLRRWLLGARGPDGPAAILYHGATTDPWIAWPDLGVVELHRTVELQAFVR